MSLAAFEHAGMQGIRLTRKKQFIKGVPRIPDTRTTGEDKGKRHGPPKVPREKRRAKRRR